MPYKNAQDKSKHNKIYCKFHRRITHPDERREYSVKNRCEICCESVSPTNKFYTRNIYGGLMVVCSLHQKTY